MGALTFDALLRSLKQGAPDSVYYLHGEEDVLKDEAVRVLLERAVDPAARLQRRPAYGRRPRSRGVQRAREHAPDTRRHPGRGPQRDGAAPQDRQGAPRAAALPRFTQSQHGPGAGAWDP